MATKKKMINEMIKLAPKLIRALCKKHNPPYDEVREALSRIKFKLKDALQKDSGVKHGN